MSTSALERALAEAVGGTNAHREGPTVTVRPGAPPEVARVLGIARERKVPLMPMGTGSLVVPRTDLGDKVRIFLDTRRMTNVLHLDEISLIVHAQAGIAVRALEDLLVGRGYTLGDFPAETYRSTLGGLLSARAPGRATSRLGPLESRCLGLSVVLADGRTVHIKASPRRATGPDLLRLFLGSEGTLGIITAAVLRIERLPETRLYAGFALPQVDAALLSVQRLLRRGVRPSAMRVYDAEEAQVTDLGAPAHAAASAGRALLLATLAGPTDLVAVERRMLDDAVTAAGGTVVGAEPAEKWWQARRAAAADPGALPAVPAEPRFEVAAPLGRLGAVYRGVRGSLLAQGAACSAFVAHFHEDGGCVYFRFPRTAEHDQAAREAAGAAGGRLARELEVDEPLAQALRGLRGELDPYGILGGGRLA